MKKIALFTLLSISLSYYAQDCSLITKEFDKFTNTVRYSTPTDGHYPITYIKSVKNNDSLIYISLRTHGSNVAIGKGVTILLSNGEKIERKNEEVNSEVESGSRIEYSVFFSLTKKEIEMLKVNDITDFRLYIFDEEIPKIPFRKMLNCLLIAK